jgi:hypothetical protein
MHLFFLPAQGFPLEFLGLQGVCGDGRESDVPYGTVFPINQYVAITVLLHTYLVKYGQLQRGTLHAWAVIGGQLFRFEQLFDHRIADL